MEVGDVSKQAMLPVQNTLQMLPLGKIVFSNDLGQRLEERAAEHDREHDLRRVQRENDRNAATYRTLR
ncbi:MAG TPA: hypothetical protein VL096_15145 [Pirellulaceae bacterium]|nr:hypothetical protein [Pirellulaceae bacterium]